MSDVTWAEERWAAEADAHRSLMGHCRLGAPPVRRAVLPARLRPLWRAAVALLAIVATVSVVAELLWVGSRTQRPTDLEQLEMQVERIAVDLRVLEHEMGAMRP